MAWSGNLGDNFGTQELWPDGTQIQQPGGYSSRNMSRANDFQAVQLKDISPHIGNTVIVGVVIAKQQPRIIPSKSDPTTDRGILSFTVRDSAVDFINATYWGSDRFICDLATKFKIGDSVEIRNPQIQSKQNTEQEERYRPWTPSQYQLSLSDKYSSLNLHGGRDVHFYNSLKHIPIRDSDNYYSLADVIANGQGLDGEHVNVLVLVRSIGTPKNVTTKTGKKMQRCEIRTYDDTCPSFPLVVWDTDTIDLVQEWIPHETVVFATDIMVKFDNFRSCMTGTVDSKTIFIMNPDTREAHTLFKFGQSHDPNDDQVEDVNKQDVDLSTIKDVYKIEDIKRLVSGTPDEPGGRTVDRYGITYAYLTAFDIDTGTRNCVSMRCASCKRRVDASSFSCINPNCSSMASDQTETVMTFDITVDVSDATGSLIGCYLGGTHVETMLKCTIDEFLQFQDDERTKLKWDYLMERCKVFFRASRAVNRPRSFIRILLCEIAEPSLMLPHL